MRKLSLIGQRFGRLKVIADYGISKWQTSTVICLCDCGEQKIVEGYLLRNGQVRSCGCLRAETWKKNQLQPGEANRGFTHGHFVGGRGSPTYLSWVGIKHLCSNPGATGYEYYGGRGITLSERWRDSFDQFLADMGEKPEGTMLRRIDKDRGFEPENCEWRLMKTNRRKKLIIAGAE